MMTEQQIYHTIQITIAFELLAESMQEFESFKFFKEVKGNSFEVMKVRQMAEKMLAKMVESLPEKQEEDRRNDRSAKLELSQMAGAIMTFSKTLLDSYCQGRAKEFTSEASALISRYDKKGLKNNPDLFRAMFMDAGASSYYCFEKGVITALKMVATNG